MCTCANDASSPCGWRRPLLVALAQFRRPAPRLPARRAVVAALLLGLFVIASARRGAFGAPLSLHGSTLELAPVLALLLALLLAEAREADVAACRLLRIGCALLVGSYVLHLLGGALANAVGEHSWAYQVGSALNEGTEVAGWLIVGLGSCPAAARNR
jgi:hypothetical protein